MHAVVSLLDDHFTAVVQDLWRELAEEFGVRQLAELVPYPHFSYHIARSYGEDQLLSRLERVAQQTAPFSLRAGGLGLFTGKHLVLHVPIVRTRELSSLHERVWEAVEGVGEGSLPYYEPSLWVPHITLAEHDVQPENLARIVARLSSRELTWKMTIDNFALIWDTGARQELRHRIGLQGR